VLCAVTIPPTDLRSFVLLRSMWPHVYVICASFVFLSVAVTYNKCGNMHVATLKIIIRYYFFYGQQCFRVVGFCVEKLKHYEIKEDKMGGSCRVHEKDNQYMHNISWKT